MKNKIVSFGTVLATVTAILLLPSQAALAAGWTWTDQAGAGTNTFDSVASSSNGKDIVAAYNNSNIKTSTDYGVTWTTHTTAASNLTFVASSTDGTHLVAADNTGGVSPGGDIWTSSNSGSSWTDQSASGPQIWNSVASSSSGQYIAATAFGNSVYVSSDYGVTWTPHAVGSALHVGGVSMSADGTHLVLVDINGTTGDIWTSSTSGTSWTNTGQNSPSAQWSGATDTSSDGTHLFVADDGSGDIYTSSNSGSTWTHISFAGDQIDSLASSSTGQYVAASGFGGGTSYLYLSSDYGVTWTQQTSSPGQGNWRGLAMSADASRIVATNVNGALWTAYNSALDPSFSTTSNTPAAQGPSTPDTGYGAHVGTVDHMLLVYGLYIVSTLFVTVGAMKLLKSK